MTRKHTATLIGLGYTAVSFLTTWTFIVPILTIMPAALILEGIFSSIFGTDPFDPVGQGVIITLAVFLTLTSFLYYRHIVKQRDRDEPFGVGLFIGFLTLQLFIIHPLGFYLYMATNWSMAGDGQLMFGVVETFPISSFAFVVLGLLTDKIKTVAKTKS